ncbi:MAG TPA: molybdopterin-binding protein [Candidatus Limnocylindrales bacterium]|nr:molybdopterin-binding protein [Candidatus Limnocylindrales bacterium]
MDGSRRLLSAELISVGSELTVGETRDTNSGELARSLTGLGVAIGRIQAVPDQLDLVVDAFTGALSRADLVVSTGGLGPTPDDLTREAIASVAGEEPAVDRDLESWLRGLWARRGIPMPDLNLKQAWLIPAATALANANGTAPGWWVDRPDGRVVVALPGPPREMRPIWAEAVVPRLLDRGAGEDHATRTFRLAGIGESAVAERLGEELLRATNPSVATYARWDAVDVRISATGSTAAASVEATAARVRDLVGDHIWAEGDTSWADAIGEVIEERRWTLASVEVGTGGGLAALVSDRPWLRLAEVLDPDAAAASTDDLETLATSALTRAAAEVAVAVRGRPRTEDTAIEVLAITPARVHREHHTVFLAGPIGRSRAGLAAASLLLAELRRVTALAAPAAPAGAAAAPQPAAGADSKASPSGAPSGSGRRGRG